MQRVEKTITMYDGTTLFSKIHRSDAQAWLVVTHGIGEYCQRHEYFTELLGDKFNIFYYDLRGHGKSSGKRAYVEHFEDYVNDLSECIAYLKREESMQEYTLFGHSMGALITCAFAQSKMKESLLPKAIFVNAPPVGIPGALGWLVDLIPDALLARLASLHVSVALGGMVNLDFLSHDPKIKKEYLEDKNNILKLHSHLLLELIRFSREVFSKPITPNVMSFCSYGAQDGIIDVKALEEYFTKVEHSFHLYKIEGAFHEIHNETEPYQRTYFDYLNEYMRSVTV